jgi:hypothetical protein
VTEPAEVVASVTGAEDPAHEAPWALQLVARMERQDPPTRAAVCRAAAVATVALLSDERSSGDGSWAAEVARWEAGRIRKHVRRARGAAWERVQALPGVTVTVDGAEVRALVPAPTDRTPKDVARLQLDGTEPEPGERGPWAALPPGTLVIAVCPEPLLPMGKAAAAAGHAAQLAWRRLDAAGRAGWAAAGFPLVVEHPDPERWAHLLATAPVVVRDGGFTVVAPGTTTAVSFWTPSQA